MLGPYEAKKGRKIRYKGNKLFGPIEEVTKKRISPSEFVGRVQSLHEDEMWPAISRINSTVNYAVGQFFHEFGALFVPLPLTTRMISSPGAVYGKGRIDYTTDTAPIKIDWFGLRNQAFLSESSQIYLELALLQKRINHVFANYHSFRKEKSDATHLSEFHHIEYEGHISQAENLRVIQGLLEKITDTLLHSNEEDISRFLTQQEISELGELFQKPIPQITLSQALQMLHKDTKDRRYQRFSLQHFGPWEEIRLTEIIGGVVGVKEMPFLEVPFYHALKDGSEPMVADNTDIIWPGYRETVGSGHRVRSIQELEEKAKLFNLPREDYEPYLQSRRFSDYRETSGFGLGWERLIQGLLKMPFIHSAPLFPRVHNSLKP